MTAELLDGVTARPGGTATVLGEQPGFVAVSVAPGTFGPDLGRLARALETGRDTERHTGPGWLSWGLGEAPDAGRATLLTGRSRRAGRVIDAVGVARLLGGPDDGWLLDLLPPFGCVGRRPDGALVVAVDTMGFRQLYRTGGPGWTAVSTSARMLALLHRDPAAPPGGQLDRRALALQSLLGWQLGLGTLFAGVEKLGPGQVLTLVDGVATTRVVEPAANPDPIDLDDAVTEAAGLLRRRLSDLLDEHPDVVLQLTGGLDSRLLLSAVPVERRRGLRAMTLGSSDSTDVRIAADLCRRYGLRHEVHDLADLSLLAPADAHALCLRAARRLDAMADPLALAALAVGERRFDQQVRISGLGGEVARGFYYLGRAGRLTRARTDRLAAWRMFVNEAVEPQVLAPVVADGARRIGLDAVYAAMTEGGDRWLDACDHLYLRHRMQRWAGVTDTAVAFDRDVVNPMLDTQFLGLVARLVPAQKADMLFLGRLQVALDPDLGTIPLDGRPAPRAYARPGALNRGRQAVTSGRKLVRKVDQRLRGSIRPPAGAELLAERVVAHWRDDTSWFDRLLELELVDPRWLASVRSGTARPSSSTVAFLVNLLAASG